MASPQHPQHPQRHEIVYAPSPLTADTSRYDVSSPRHFAGDTVAAAGIADLTALASSPHWEDRVRAEVLRRRASVTLPDQFPCIFETPDSPNRAGQKDRLSRPWVVSPDLDMLTDLLGDYQDLWDAYTRQWGPDARRTFAVGRLDGLSATGVYRPGTTPAQVIAATMLTHTGMYQPAPERLQRMHPMYDAWHATPAR